MNIKKTILFSTIALFFVVTSCTNKKESISKSIIDSYVQAVQEEDKGMIIKTFPRIVYFEEYPKIDSIKINEYEEIGENILAKGTLNFTNGFGKKFDKKIQLLVDLRDSTIIDVLGFLTRKKRNEIIAYKTFETFPDLKPSEADFDATYLEKKQIAFNRINGFEYYAQKAIGERTEIKFTSSSKVRYSYGIKMGYYNTKILIDIRNNSDFNIKYEYVDDNYGYNYTFPDFTIQNQDEYGSYTKGSWLIKSNEAVSQSAIVKKEQIFEYEKDKISIKPNFENVKEAMIIVKKYYDSKTVDSIMAGKKDYWNDYYNYKIDVK
jgi:hypothetical protein